ncbi:hypothetical protein Hdeb2414_s0017g00512021 [Helianthus debilis subsp. tardiflorus]
MQFKNKRLFFISVFKLTKTLGFLGLIRDFWFLLDSIFFLVKWILFVFDICNSDTSSLFGSGCYTPPQLRHSRSIPCRSDSCFFKEDIDACFTSIVKS